jgi:hypothetical protein
MTGTGSAGEARAYRILAAPAVGSEVLLDTRSYKSVFVPAGRLSTSAMRSEIPYWLFREGSVRDQPQSCADATGT